MSDRLPELLRLPKDQRAIIAAALALSLGMKLEKLKADPNTLPVEAAKAGVTAQMVDDAVSLWNTMAMVTAEAGQNPAHRLPKVLKLNPANRRALALRLAEFGAAGWRACVEAVYKSAHCRGINDRGWKADITYLLQPKGSNKAINGGWPADYQEKTRGGQRTGPSGRGDQRLDGIRGFDAAIRGGLAARDGRPGGSQEGGGQPEAAGGGQDSTQPRLAIGGPDHA